MKKIKPNREALLELAKAIYLLKQRMLLNPLRYFEPQDYQREFWESEKKEKFVFGGNRCGKTMNGAAYSLKKCEENPGFKAWAATWAALSIPIQQKKIYDLLSKSKVSYAKYSEQSGFSNRVIIFKNKSVLRFKTYDQGADKFQGADEDLIWNDEEPPEDVYKEELMRVVDRDGEVITTMTPVNGITWTYTGKVQNQKLKNILDYWFWETMKNKKINLKAFESIISQFAVKEAEVRSTGHFLNLNSGRLYYAFDRMINSKRLKVRKDLPIGLSFDFNVDPMTTTIFQIVPGIKALNEQERVINIIEALNNRNCNTRMQCESLRDRLINWTGEIVIYGDASSQRRTESADINDTNWTYVKKYFPDATYKVPKTNPNIKERVAWGNAKIKNFYNEIGLYVNDTGCNDMIIDLEQGTWAKDGKTKDKTNPVLNHNTDNLDYIISKEFPLCNIIPMSSVEIVEEVYQSITTKLGI